jgi:transposase
MYLRATSQRRIDGAVITHLQIAESVWDTKTKRSTTRVIYNCGRADDAQVQERLRKLARGILRRCSPEEIVADNPGWRVEDAWPYGDVHVLEKLWERLGIGAVIEEQTKQRKFGFSVERALFAMVANRLCAPCSKLYCWEQWLREDVRIEGANDLELQHLYRAMDFLEANKDAIEKEIFHRVSDLLNLDVEIVFYDTTSLHFEVDEEDHGIGVDDVVQGSKQAGAKSYRAPRKRGHSKNGRSDAPQIVVGLAVTREGFPIRHWIFPGNTVDVTTVKKVREDLRGWRMSRCVFVGDAGMVSEENLHALSAAGGKYIVCMPMRREKEVAHDVIRRAGRYKKVADNLRVKEVVVGDGERRRRYVVCHNPQEERRQLAHRAQVLTELRAELASLKDVEDNAHSKRLCELRASGRYGKFLRFNKAGKPEINMAKVRDEERLDGKFVVHSDDDTLSPEDMALGYKQLQRVEEAWRAMKSGLKLRPVFHWAPHRIHAHVAITVLALLLERTAEHACDDTWRNIRDDLQTLKLARLSGPEGKVWQTTEPRPEALKRLKSLSIPNPPLIVNLA